ncbi:MAG: uracil-DNA glycosylase family protein [Candidatus Binatia bacterium]
MSRLSDREEIGLIAASLRCHIQRGERAGIRYLPRAESGGKSLEEYGADLNPGEGFEGNLFSDYTSAYRSKSLGELRAAIGDCRRCKLWPGRTHLVFGVGNPKAKVMFVGEGPGREEDIQGEPFVGRAGHLLTDIITKGMGLRREDVYIANVIKCRPPDNRNPESDEIESCEPFLVKQIELIRPRVIVGLGKFAVQTLLKSKVPIMRLRGVWHQYRGTKLMPTLHPAYLLRNPGDKKLVWEDIKKVLQELRSPSV